MTSLRFAFLFFGFVAVSLRNVKAITEEERTKAYANILPHVAECSKEFGVTEDEIKAAKEAGSADNINPCLIGCVMKKVHVIDDKGLFVPEKAVEMTKKYLSNESDVEKATDIIKTCSSVNDKEVGDGEKGCERAKLLIDCFIPFKDQFIARR